jgi:type I restriction enzyme R subunit
LNAERTEFLNLVVDRLTEGGKVDPGIFYESPFTDLDDMGIAGIFARDQAQGIINNVRAMNEAVASSGS